MLNLECLKPTIDLMEQKGALQFFGYFVPPNIKVTAYDLFRDYYGLSRPLFSNDVDECIKRFAIICAKNSYLLKLIINLTAPSKDPQSDSWFNLLLTPESWRTRTLANTESSNDTQISTDSSVNTTTNSNNAIRIGESPQLADFSDKIDVKNDDLPVVTNLSHQYDVNAFVNDTKNNLKSSNVLKINGKSISVNESIAHEILSVLSFNLPQLRERFLQKFVDLFAYTTVKYDPSTDPTKSQKV